MVTESLRLFVKTIRVFEILAFFPVSGADLVGVLLLSFAALLPLLSNLVAYPCLLGL